MSERSSDVGHSDSDGLHDKYALARTDGRPVVGWHFVLRPGNDHAAQVAVRAYAEACASTNPTLSRDLLAKLDAIGPHLCRVCTRPVLPGYTCRAYHGPLDA